MPAGDWMLGSGEARSRFIAQHPVFFDGSEILERAFAVAFCRPFTASNSADAMIYLLGSRCSEDFREIVLLAANGHGWGATAHLRGMYERAVTAAYLRQTPAAVDAFVEYDYVRRWKVACKIRETMGISAEDESGMRILQAHFDAVKERFYVPHCDHCDKQRINHTWTRLDFVSMAASVGTLGKSIVGMYYLPLAQAHATAASAAFPYSQTGNAFALDPFSAEQEADRTCEFAHLLALGVLTLQHDHFGVPELGEILDSAYEHFKASWHPDQAG